MDIVHIRNCVYQTAYHLVWCPKFRRQILVGDVVTTLKTLLESICKDRGWIIIALEIQPDHVHLFISFPPASSISNVVKILKGSTARLLFLRHPSITEKLWGGHLWSPSYYAGTAGSVSAETIQKYIERTEHMKSRR